MTIYELSNLDNLSLNNLLLQYDNWEIDHSTKKVFKVVNEKTIDFDLVDFSPFSNFQQADIILNMSCLDFSQIKTNDRITWGLCVFEDKQKKYLLLQSESQFKSSLLLLIAIRSGILE